MLEFFRFNDQHYPSGAKKRIARSVTPQLKGLVYLLRQCGDDLTRGMFMRQAGNLRNVENRIAASRITMNKAQRFLSNRSVSNANAIQWIDIGFLFGPS